MNGIEGSKTKGRKAMYVFFLEILSQVALRASGAGCKAGTKAYHELSCEINYETFGEYFTF